MVDMVDKEEGSLFRDIPQTMRFEPVYPVTEEPCLAMIEWRYETFATRERSFCYEA